VIITIAKRTIVHLLSRCVGVASRKSTMPILENVLLTADDEANTLTIAATDLQLAVSGSVPATVKSGGTIALGARGLLERLRAMPDGEIAISTTDACAATIKAVGSSRRFTVQGIPGDEFPTLPTPAEESRTIDLPAETLATLIAQTSSAIADDETRVHLNGALFEVERGVVRMVATDGHRLAVATKTTDVVGAALSALVPRRGILELKRLIEDDPGAIVSVTLSMPNAFFDVAGFRTSVKLADAVFPPYQQVIPESSQTSLAVPRLAFADAIRAVSVSSSGRTGGISLKIGGGKILIEASSPESGEGSDTVPIASDAKCPDAIGVNAPYLLDALLAIDSEEVTLELGGDLDPIVVKPGTVTSGGSYLAIVMPLRI
jgi:DNA polymerase-3 subunit beta